MACHHNFCLMLPYPRLLMPSNTVVATMTAFVAGIRLAAHPASSAVACSKRSPNRVRGVQSVKVWRSKTRPQHSNRHNNGSQARNCCISEHFGTAAVRPHRPSRCTLASMPCGGGGDQTPFHCHASPVDPPRPRTSLSRRQWAMPGRHGEMFLPWPLFQT